MDLRTVGVIGAGVMGRGVAQVLAQTDHKVILIDLSSNILDEAFTAIRNDLRLQSMLKKFSGSSAAAVELITFTTEYDVLSKVDFVVENVVEKWDVKREVYRRMDGICPQHCVFAANTSAMSITRIGSATDRPDRVLGMHFMNPVPMKNTVEVIRGFHTSDETLELGQRLLSQMGKEGIVVDDAPGFVSNRILMLTINEAAFVLQDQVASARKVDEIFKKCFGHPMGPLETADLIGLDTILYSIEVLYESYNDSKYRPCPLLRKMVDAGLYGRKSGRGFHTYVR